MKKFLPLLVAGTVLVGCMTQQPNWTSRIGIYTFDTAVTEYGPPDRQAVLSNGTRVAEWITSPGFYQDPFYTGGYGYGYGYSPYFNPVPASVLRLTFGADGKLATWMKLRR